MSDSLSRRDFLGAASGVTVGAFIGLPGSKTLGAPAVHTRQPSQNVAVASANGLRGVERAGRLMVQGMDTLDAAIEGIKIQELDPNDSSVGYGGLPNEHGVVQLDAACMHGPTNRVGAVGALEGIKTPSVVAKYILLYTDHIFLFGEGAKQFALSYGFKDEELMTERSRQRWLRWRAKRGGDDDRIDVDEDEEMVIRPRPTGSINMNVVNTAGDISSVTTTSGLAWEIPGRIRDIPAIGLSQYIENAIGAAGSTGRGEAYIKVCGAILTVQAMRRGMSPTDAALETLRWVVAKTEPRFLNEQGRPISSLNFYAVNKRGEFGAGSMYPSRYAAFDGKTAAIHDTAPLFEER